MVCKSSIKVPLFVPAPEGERSEAPPFKRRVSGHRGNMHRIDTVYAQWCLTAVVAFRA